MRKLLFLLLILGIIWFVWYYWHSLKAPTLSDEEMRTKVGMKEVEVTPTWTLNVIEGKYLSFSVKIPVYHQDDDGMKQSASLLEGHKFYGGIPKIMAVVMVEANNKVSIFRDMPGVLLRDNDKEKYSVRYDKKDGYKVAIYESTTEKGAYWFGEGKTYSVVVSGSDKTLVNENFGEIWTSLKVLKGK